MMKVAGMVVASCEVQAGVAARTWSARAIAAARLSTRRSHVSSQPAKPSARWRCVQ